MYCIDYDGAFHIDEEEQIQCGESDCPVAATWLSIEMHYMADRYDIRGLQEIPALKFRQALCRLDSCGIHGDKSKWLAVLALKITEKVYQTTRSDKDGIQKAVNSFI